MQLKEILEFGSSGILLVTLLGFFAFVRIVIHGLHEQTEAIRKEIVAGRNEDRRSRKVNEALVRAVSHLLLRGGGDGISMSIKLENELALIKEVEENGG